MSKISLAPDASGTGIFSIVSPNSNTNRTLTLPDDTGTIVTNSGNQAGSFTTLNTSGAVVFNDAGADVDFRVEGDTDANLLFVNAGNDRVGIGTASPLRKFQVDDSANAIVARIVSGQTSSWMQFAASGNNTASRIGSPNGDGVASLAFMTADTTRMTIDSSGNVGIGVTPSTWTTGFGLKALQVGPVGSLASLAASATNKQVLLSNNNYFDGTNYVYVTAGGYASQYAQISGSHIFYNAPIGTNAGDTVTFTERMRIESNGRILIGKTVSENFAFDMDFDGASFNGLRVDNVTGGTPVLMQAAAAGVSRFLVYNDGSTYLPAVYNDTVTGRDLYISSGGQLGYVSSVRASKTNIEDLPSIDWLYQLNPVKFQYRTKDEEGNYTETADAEIQYGLIAEDVAEVNLDLVFGDETENGFELRGVQYSRLIAPLLQAVKDLKAVTDTQAQTIAALEARIAALETGA